MEKSLQHWNRKSLINFYSPIADTVSEDWTWAPSIIKIYKYAQIKLGPGVALKGNGIL